MKRSVSIILVNPENSDNIGAVARAMKNMGIQDLRLVSPPQEWQERGKKMAVSAGDMLENASVYTNTRASIQDASLVLGTTRRTRRYKSNLIPFAEALKKIENCKSSGKRAAILFGKESKGLSNSDLDCCDWVTVIPTAPVYPSINLAQAVMVVCFMIAYRNTADLTAPEMGAGGDKVSKSEEYEVLETFKSAVEKLGYSPKSQLVDRITFTFHGLLKRAGLLKREAQMFKGLSRRIREKVSDRLNVA